MFEPDSIQSIREVKGDPYLGTPDYTMVSFYSGLVAYSDKRNQLWVWIPYDLDPIITYI